MASGKGHSVDKMSKPATDELESPSWKRAGEGTPAVPSLWLMQSQHFPIAFSKPSGFRAGLLLNTISHQLVCRISPKLYFRNSPVASPGREEHEIKHRLPC